MEFRSMQRPGRLFLFRSRRLEYGPPLAERTRRHAPCCLAPRRVRSVSRCSEAVPRSAPEAASVSVAPPENGRRTEPFYGCQSFILWTSFGEVTCGI